MTNKEIKLLKNKIHLNLEKYITIGILLGFVSLITYNIITYGIINYISFNGIQ